jgi:hypothetical protein
MKGTHIRDHSLADAVADHKDDLRRLGPGALHLGQGPLHLGGQKVRVQHVLFARLVVVVAGELVRALHVVGAPLVVVEVVECLSECLDLANDLL